MEIKITKDNFEAEVVKADRPVLVDFWATWCGPCMMLGPVVAEIAEERNDVIKVGKVNVDEEPELAAKFGKMTGGLRLGTTPSQGMLTPQGTRSG